MIKRILIAASSAAAMLMGSAAYAGPFILAGTDADDHGFVNGGGNQDGWLFMQKALENLGGAVTNGNKVVTILGSTGAAATAANSAFNLSSLVAGGWTVNTVSTANFATFFGTGGGLSGSGILMMDSNGNIGGGVNGALFNPYATAIDNFLGLGGGLFSQANGYSWLSTLVPGLTVVSQFATGLALTTAGMTAFPALNNGDLSAGPWHNSFSGTGAIPILATSTTAGSTFGAAVIIGGATGSITNPGGGNVPEPGTLALLAVALGAAGMLRKKKTA